MLINYLVQKLKLKLPKTNKSMKNILTHRCFGFLFLVLLLQWSKVVAQSTEIRPGIVLPQMTTTQRTSMASPTDGMLVFDTNTQSYWYGKSGSWTELPQNNAVANFWQQTGVGGNEIKNTNSGGFWSVNTTGLTVYADDLSNPPTTPVSGTGTRLMWIPSRSAFRVGTLDGNYSPTAWDASNIGLFSFASGLNTTAKGYASTAMGAFATARGDYSTTMGSGNAIGASSTAMGNNTIANGDNSTAIGSNTIASGNSSIAVGTNNVDNYNGLLMVGNGTYGAPKTVFIITKDNNRVGIGTETPLAPLHVAGQSTITGSMSGRLFNFGSNNLFSYTGNEFPSIIAEAAIISKTTIGAFQNIAASDNRIKNILSLSNNAEDLTRLCKIEITNYRMKDVATWGNQTFKKVIAQQVESVYPEVIKRQTAVIPDIYALAEKTIYDATNKNLTVSLSKSYEIKIGDKIELVHSEKGKIQAVVASVSGNDFVVKDWLYPTDKIFVFGREVNDFRSVDYEALSMLGISAIQQLAKENEAMKIKNEEIFARLQKLESLEKRLIELEVNNPLKNTLK